MHDGVSSRPLRILILSQYYTPENVPIPEMLATGLKALGHSVRVITGFPNYPQGKIFEGYKQRWRKQETIEGVDVLRVPMFMDHSQRAIPRMLNYLTFALSSSSAHRFAKNADVIYVYATQMTPVLGPWTWRLIGGSPYVVHVQDLWPDSIIGSSLVQQGTASKLISRLLKPWLKSTYKRASAIIGIAPGMVRMLVERGAPSDRTHLVFNWAREIQESSVKHQKSDREIVAVFAGNIGDMQDLSTVVRAAHRVRDTNLRVRIIGDGVALSEVREIANQLKAHNVEFIGQVPPEEMRDIYSMADFSLVTLKNLPVFESTIPSKLQASLAHGLPIITTVQGDVRDIVQQNHVGFVANPENIDSLEAAFREAVALNDIERIEMAQRASELYNTTFSSDSAICAIEKILSNVAKNQSERLR